MAIEEKARMKQRRGTTFAWTNSNEVLLDGELGVERPTSGSDLYKIGDGSTPWNSLPYLAVENFSSADNNDILRKVAVQQGIDSALNSDTRIPTQNENDALTGTNGSPSIFNKFVTDSDPRLLSGDFVSMDVYKLSTGSLSGRPLYITALADLDSPPPLLPSEGDKYIMTTGGGSLDAGWPASTVEGDIVEYRSSTYTRFPPEKGWSVYLGYSVYTYDGSAWNQSYRVSSDINGALAGTSGTPSAANPFVTDSDSRLVNVSEPYTFYVLSSHSTQSLTQNYATTIGTYVVTYPISGFSALTSFNAANIRRFYITYKYYVSNKNVCTMDYYDVTSTYVEVASATGINSAPGTIVDAGGGGMVICPVAPGQTNLVLRANVSLFGGYATNFWTYTIHGVDVRG